MEHLPHCRLVRDFSERSLGLPTLGTPGERNADFLLLGADEGDVLVLKAVRLAALYTVHCKARFASWSIQEPSMAFKAVEQAAKEAVMGHAAATRAFDRRWWRAEARDPARRPDGYAEAAPLPRRRRINN